MTRDSFIIRKVRDSDLNEVLLIFNYYIKNGFAAYPEEEVSIEFFYNIMQNSLNFYILEIKERIVGFAFLKNYLPYENFKLTGVLTYFIDHKYTNKGFGTLLLKKLIKDAIDHGIQVLLINLSSLNEQSIKFHKNHGFIECGRFKNIAKKFNQEFDIIWMQRNL
ncbi:MAG: GNAT family N-acetyltransferase [Promethearchaeota archaeon]